MIIYSKNDSLLI